MPLVRIATIICLLFAIINVVAVVHLVLGCRRLQVLW